jgi:hypothetical protein
MLVQVRPFYDCIGQVCSSYANLCQVKSWLLARPSKLKLGHIKAL